MDDRPVIVLDIGVEAEAPIRFDGLRHEFRRHRRAGDCREDIEAFAEIQAQRRAAAGRGKPTKDQRAAGIDLDGIEAWGEVARRAAEYGALRNIDRLAVFVVPPLVEAANEPAVPLVGVAQRERTMRL